jgi:lipopolysaccharide export system protein LptA
MKNPVVPNGLLLAALFLAVPAFAERADRDKPVNLEADTVEVNDITGVSVYQGNVRLIQGSLLMTADKVVVVQDQEGFAKSTAYGNPTTFRQKREGVDEYVDGAAQRMEYDAKKDQVQLFTQARVRRGLDEVRGNYISYDSVNESYRVLGGKEAATEYNPKGRVRAVIQPKHRATPPAADGTALPLKSTEGIGAP